MESGEGMDWLRGGSQMERVIMSGGDLDYRMVVG